MKVELKINPDGEERITIEANALTSDIQKLYAQLKQLEEQSNQSPTIIGYKDDLEIYLKTDTILYFETIDEIVYAHTRLEAYVIKSRLYELEKKLPHQFMRISKTTILNVNYLHAIEKGFGGPRMIQFLNTSKSVYVSRKYYPLLHERLKERLT